jgi:hypothetical protein
MIKPLFIQFRMSWTRTQPSYESLETIVCTRLHSQLSTEPENCISVVTYVRRAGDCFLARVYLRRVPARMQEAIDRCVALHAADWRQRNNWDFELADYAFAFFPELYMFLSHGFDQDLFTVSLPIQQH